MFSAAPRVNSVVSGKGAVGGLLATLVFALAVAGCGGSSERAGGTIRVGITAAPDSLDPALAATLPALEPIENVYTPLLTYRYASGSAGNKIVPALADDLPQISADRKRYTLTLRDGLTYSDGTPVKASDFERAVQRLLALNSPFAPFFQGIDGAEQDLGKNPPTDISGIQTNDSDRTITIKLLAPDSTFPNVLSLLAAAPVPSSTPVKDLTSAPPPGVGPYEISDVHPGRGLALERVKDFDLENVPAGHVDRIDVEVVTNISTQTEQVQNGTLDYMQDPPPAGLLPQVRTQDADRFREETTGGTNYFFLNQSVPPFDDSLVRQAVNYAVDRAAIQRIYGGLIEPDCTILPPELPGYKPFDPCPFAPRSGPPNLDKARALIKQAGAEGSDVVVWGPTEEPARTATQEFADTLNQIGLHATPQLVGFSTYIPTIGNQATKAQAGLVNFLQDFPHPSDYLSLFSADSITPTNNLNFGNVDDPKVNAEISRLSPEPLSQAQDGWANVDHQLDQGADLVPLGFPKRTTFFSNRMNFDDCALFHPVYQNVYSSFCLK